MRIRVFKLENGRLSALVEPTPGRRMSPVLIPDITPENVVNKTLEVVTKLRRPGEGQPNPQV